MTRALASLGALPLGGLRRHPDVILGLFVAFVVAMLVIPLPSLVLDLLIALNLAIAVLILMVCLFAQRALNLSAFPAMLLITTLFRLGLNVSTTRGILSRGEAGAVVHTFGTFVLGGDLVVGAVIFGVITIVQFMVVAKGSERVAEVAARFTLDAMPGKQMSIDAALRAGAISDEEAQAKRDELGRESQLFGAMDGAMKFVKGDAVAGLIITGLNLSAGFAIGVLRFDLSLAEAADVYTTLTVGDGLVSQVPALLITIGAGFLVTNVEAANKTNNLGFTLREQILASPKVLGVAALLVGALGLVPGLPFVVFGPLALGLAIAAVAAASRPTPPGDGFAKRVEAAKAQRSMVDKLAPGVVPIMVDLDPTLSSQLGFGESETRFGETELIDTYIPQLRDALFLETGVRFPGVRVRASVRELEPGSFVIRVRDVPVARGKLDGTHPIAMVPPERLRRLGVTAAADRHPLHGGEVSRLEPEDREVVEAAGISVWSPAGVLALHLARVLRPRAREFLGFQEVAEMVEKMEQTHPALVREVVPKVVSVPELTDVLRRLVDEGVSIRDLRAILEALGERGDQGTDGVFLTEVVRGALSAQIAYAHAGMANRLSVVLLDPAIEDSVRSAIEETRSGPVLALEPGLCRAIVRTIASAIEPMALEGTRPAILTGAEIRRYVRKLIELELPAISVLSYEELPPTLTVQPVARASL